MLIKLTFKKLKKVDNQKMVYDVCAFLLLFLVIISRCPKLFGQPYLWAEDATIFFTRAINYGIGSVVVPYAGYFHFIPQFLAVSIYSLCSIVNIIPILPQLSYFSAVIIETLIFLYFIVGDFDFVLPNKLMRLFVSIVTIFMIPANTFEVWYTITNLQWWFEILLFFIGLQFAFNASHNISVAKLVIVLCIGLSTPAIVLLLGVILIVCAYKIARHQLVKKELVYLSVTIIPVILQMFSSSANRGVSKGVVEIIMTAFKNIFFYLPVYEYTNDFSTYDYFVISIILYWIIILSFAVLGRKNKTRLKLLSYCFFYALFCAVIASAANSAEGSYAGRYAFCPSFVFAFFIIVSIGESVIDKRLDAVIKEHSVCRRMQCFLLMGSIILYVGPTRTVMAEVDFDKFFDVWTIASRYYSNNQEHYCYIQCAPGGLWGLNLPISFNEYLEKTNGTRFISYIDSIASQPFSQVNEGITIESYNQSTVQISGWIIDEAAEKSANAVFVGVNSVFFPAQKQNRSDVAEYYAYPMVIDSGFVAEIPVGSFQEGENTVELVMITNDNTQYATASYKVRIIM